MWTFSWTRGLVQNLVSIRPNYNVDNLQKFEDNLHCLGLSRIKVFCDTTKVSGFDSDT